MTQIHEKKKSYAHASTKVIPTPHDSCPYFPPKESFSEKHYRH